MHATLYEAVLARLEVRAGGARSRAAGGMASAGLVATVGPTPHEARAATYEQCPHEGYVFLDRVREGEYWLTHIATRERRRLPGGSVWELEFQDGMGFVLDVGAEEPQGLEVDEILQSHLFVKEPGQELVMMSRTPEGSFKFRRSLPDDMARFKEGLASVRMHGTSAQATFQLAVFVMPRTCNSRAFWSFFRGGVITCPLAHPSSPQCLADASS